MHDAYSAAGDPGAGVLMQLLPSMIIQIIYSIVVFKMARKQGWNAWLWTIGSLIPIIGLIVLAVAQATTILKTLDRLNVLEGKTAN
jgi:hypothetical protein